MGKGDISNLPLEDSALEVEQEMEEELRHLESLIYHRKYY